MSLSKTKVIYDKSKDKFEDWCHFHNLPTGTNQFGRYDHPTVREYWIVWAAAWDEAGGE